MREEVVNLLLNLGNYQVSQNEIVTVDPSDFGNQAITSACEFGREKIVDLLLAHEKVDATNNGHDSALQIACMEGHFEIVKKLLKWYEDKKIKNAEYGNNFYSWGYLNAIKMTVKRKHENILKLLLEDERTIST